MRKSYAKRQGRELNMEELNEYKTANENLEALKSSSTGKIKQHVRNVMS